MQQFLRRIFAFFLPVVPVAIRGSYKCFQANSLKKIFCEIEVIVRQLNGVTPFQPNNIAEQIQKDKLGYSYFVPINKKYQLTLNINPARTL